MKVLAPIDGSECGYRALSFATEFVTRYDGTLHVIHITTEEGPATDRVLHRAEELLVDSGVTADPEVVTDIQTKDPRYGTRKGKDILNQVEQKGYDHVIMGHHGTGAVGRLVLGSAAQTVIQATEVSTTVIP